MKRITVTLWGNLIVHYSAFIEIFKGDKPVLCLSDMRVSIYKGIPSLFDMVIVKILNVLFDSSH